MNGKQRVQGDGVELSYRLWPGRAAPVVALHGLTGTLMQFNGIAERLAPGRGLFAFDLRGRGDSQRPADARYGVTQHARDAAAAMKALGLGRSIVLGYSLGAFVATELAGAFPDLVAGVLLLDAGAALTPRVGQTPAAFMAELLGPLVARLETSYPSIDAYLAHWRGLQVFSAAEWSPWVEAWLRDDVSPAPPHRPKADVSAVRADFSELVDAVKVEARLSRLAQPISLLRAELGNHPGTPPLFTDAMAARVRACIGARLDERLLRGVNHYAIALAEPGASAVAEAITALAGRCGL